MELTREEKQKIILEWKNQKDFKLIKKKTNIDEKIIKDYISFYCKRRILRLQRNNRNFAIHQQGFSSWVDEILFQTWYNILDL